MNKQENKTEEFDFNIDSLFGDFSALTPGLTGDNEPSVPELSKEQEEEIKKSLETTEDSEEDDKDKKESKKDIKKELQEEDEDSEVEEDEVEDSTEDSKESEEESDGEVEYSYKALASYLSEQGLVDFEDSDELEDSPEIIEQVVLTTAKNMVEEYKSSIPEEGKQFLDYLEKGGDPSKYIQTLERPLDFDNLDLEDESIQKRVIQEYLTSQEYSKEEITELIQDYEDGLLLAKQAKLASKKLEKVYNKKKEQLLAQQEAELEERNKQIEEYTASIKNTITKATELGGLDVSAKDKAAFEKYLLERSKDGLTQYERELQADPIKTSLELAFLKFKKFDFSKIATKEKTKEAKRIKGLIKSKDTTVKGASKRITGANSGDLDAFKGFI